MLRHHGVEPRRIITWVVLAFACIWVIFPFYWAVITSIKDPADEFALAIIPFYQFRPTTMVWQEEFREQGGPILHAVSNSVVVSTSAVVIALILGTLAAYGLARFKFRRWKNRDITLWFLSQRFLPPVATIFPFFLIMKTAHLLDTRWALILVDATFILPFAVLILRDTFKALPEELEESALVDGCSRIGAFTRIALPLSAPALVAAAIICFSFAWNEFLFALVLTYENARTVPVYIAMGEGIQGIAFWYVAVRVLIAIVPPILLSLLVQRYIVRGLTLGAVKG